LKKRLNPEWTKCFCNPSSKLLSDFDRNPTKYFSWFEV